MHRFGKGRDALCRIVCTQPRRVAAITIAKRVSEELKCALGSTVGYTVRFDDKTSSDTKIKYVTDGVLLREAIGDPELSGYSTIIIDESHERSLQSDVLMGLLKDLQHKRTKDELRVIVMSATLDTSLFESFFLDSITVTIPGRQYPVQALYLRRPEEDYIDAALLTCIQVI